MCGIFGSNDFERYVKLYDQNKKRGTFSYGGLFSDNKLHAIIKTPGIIKLSSRLQLKYKKTKKDISDFNLFLGHTQAPTSAKRKATPDTIHPFVCGSWNVAHNGVLTNDKQLKKGLAKSYYNEVDSSVIPGMLHVCEKTTKSHREIFCICNVLSKLEGTFGLWIYNGVTKNTYLARSGSTLYANLLTNDFSSLPNKEFEELKEGVLYLLTNEGITSVGEFKPNSPFFAP